MTIQEDKVLFEFSVSLLTLKRRTKSLSKALKGSVEVMYALKHLA